MTAEEALAAVDACFESAFGDAGAKVVVEEFLQGDEASFFCLCDGRTAVLSARRRITSGLVMLIQAPTLTKWRPVLRFLS